MACPSAKLRLDKNFLVYFYLNMYDEHPNKDFLPKFEFLERYKQVCVHISLNSAPCRWRSIFLGYVEMITLIYFLGQFWKGRWKWVIPTPKFARFIKLLLNPKSRLFRFDGPPNCSVPIPWYGILSKQKRYSNWQGNWNRWKSYQISISIQCTSIFYQINPGK